MAVEMKQAVDKAKEVVKTSEALDLSRVWLQEALAHDYWSVSVKAAGWRLIGEVKGRSWSCTSRPRTDKHPIEDKQLFEAANYAR